MPKKAIILTADQFEDLEVLVPKNRLEEAGWTVDVAAPRRGRVEGEHGYEVEARWDLDEVEPDDYDLLLIPGGPPEGGAGTVRSYRSARRVVQAFMEADKPVAAICHGPWVLVSADVVEGRRLTSVKKDGVPDEIEDEGGKWVDEEVVVDGNLVTSRTPRDLPAFLREVMRLVEKGGSRARRAPKKAARKRSDRASNGVARGDGSRVVEVSPGMT
ncbi:MAG: protease [Thermoplasmata archaeon]|jgi:protease I|nr:protease [Thermoplasmata archaeon]